MGIEINKIYCGSNIELMAKMQDSFIDLTVTSPPYSSMRTYNGYSFDFENTAKELFRVTKNGGVVVWVVGDKIKKGNKETTSLKQAIFFQSIGFNFHDHMIYKKKNTPFMRSNAYTNCFEHMFVFSKGSPKTFNPLKEPTKRSGIETAVYGKGADGDNSKRRIVELKKEKTRTNIFEYAVGLGGSTNDKIAFKHPAIFPEALATDMIYSFSNEGDIVYDPFGGSSTVAKCAMLLNRNWIISEISKEYCDIAEKRIKPYLPQNNLF